MRINSLSNVHTSQRDVCCVVFLLFLAAQMAFSASFDVLVSRLLNLGPVVRRPISANLRLNFRSGFLFL